MKLAPLDTFSRLRAVSLVTRSVPVWPFWRLRMRPVSSRGISSTEPCFVSGCTSIAYPTVIERVSAIAARNSLELVSVSHRGVAT